MLVRYEANPGCRVSAAHSSLAPLTHTLAWVLATIPVSSYSTHFRNTTSTSFNSFKRYLCCMSSFCSPRSLLVDSWRREIERNGNPPSGASRAQLSLEDLDNLFNWSHYETILHLSHIRSYLICKVLYDHIVIEHPSPFPKPLTSFIRILRRQLSDSSNSSP